MSLADGGKTTSTLKEDPFVHKVLTENKEPSNWITWDINRLKSLLKKYVCYYQDNPHVKRIHPTFTKFKDLTKVVLISHTTAKHATFMRIVV